MTLAFFLLFVPNVNIATAVSKCFSHSLLRDLALNSMKMLPEFRL